MYEKKYIAFSDEDRKKIAQTYHNWQSVKYKELYSDVKEYCASVKKEDLDDYSLVTSKYIEFDRNTDTVDYDKEMKKIQNELRELFVAEASSRAELQKVMEELGYGIMS